MCYAHRFSIEFYCKQNSYLNILFYHSFLFFSFSFFPLYSPLMWQYLKTVVTFLRSFKRDLQEQLIQAQGRDNDAKCLSVQQSLMNALRPFGIPGNTDPNTIDIVIQKNDMKDLGGMYLFVYLLCERSRIGTHTIHSGFHFCII